MQNGKETTLGAIEKAKELHSSKFAKEAKAARAEL